MRAVTADTNIKLIINQPINKMKETVIKPRNCAECGTLFYPRSITAAHALYCCKSCKKRVERRRAKELKRERERMRIAEQIPDSQSYLSVSEAVSIFQVSQRALYRKIEEGTIECVRFSSRKIRIKRSILEGLFPTRKEHKVAEPLKPKPRLYRLEPEDCYTIGEITEKFRIGETTVYTNIRKYHIPMRQIGRFVYVPKNDVEEFFHINDKKK